MGLDEKRGGTAGGERAGEVNKKEEEYGRERRN